MKNFNEFVKTLDPVVLSEVSAKACASQDDAIAGITQASTAVTIQLLYQYHEWLTAQLSELHQE